MKLDENYLEELIESISAGSDIKLSDIPDIDLYMDQVTTFIDNKLGHLKRNDDDKLLTKTMINNYTKSKILLPSKNKKYNRQHMILLILIYYLKQIISINDIHSLFTPLFKSLSSGKTSEMLLEDVYSAFLEIKCNELERAENAFDERVAFIREKVDGFKPEDRDMGELLLTVVMLVTQANAQKRLAEKIIDRFFESKKE